MQAVFPGVGAWDIPVLESVDIFGRLTIDTLGNGQPDTRNSCLAAILEILGSAENRFSGIPTIRREFSYVVKTYITPLVEKGLINLTIPEVPKSKKQRYVTNHKT